MYDLVLVQQKLLFHNEFDAMQSFQFLFHFVQSRFQIFHKTSWCNESDRIRLGTPFDFDPI